MFTFKGGNGRRICKQNEIKIFVLHHQQHFITVRMSVSFRLIVANVTILILVALTSSVSSAPQSNQKVFSSFRFGEHPDWEPLRHSSGISPYHDAPGADIEPPQGCSVTAAAFLIRHSSIYANDDEWEEYMQPFVERVKDAKGAFPEDGPLGFLNDWESPINEDNLEKLTKPGIKDAEKFGKRFRKLYPHLLPPKKLGKKKGMLDNLKVKVPFKVWTASSERDIGTAKAFIRGAFPKYQEGHGGEGDGKYISLVEVPNKDPNWSASLTPHKVCDRFTKEEGRNDAREYLRNWGPGPLAKLQALAPSFEFELKDVIAIQMLCGYESVIKGIGKSKFCDARIFDAKDYYDYEYFHDLIYHKMVGYASPVAPYLGVHWLNTSTHNLLSAEEGEGDHPHRPYNAASKKDPNLPAPPGPPNSTHTQKLFAYFTHREEPPMALVALGLWNQTTVGPLPLDIRQKDRVWRTSHVLPFLGHVAIERMRCDDKQNYIRAIVNGAAQAMDHCQDGPGNSCPIDQFKEFVDQRMTEYGDIEGACKVSE